MPHRLYRLLPLLTFLAVSGLLIAIYWPTALRQPGSGDDPFMDDVGEIQVALNLWGTIHHTGYPLYTILGNTAVTALRAFGSDPATAPVIYSAIWGFAGLAAFYALILRLTARIGLAAAGTLILGLTRTVWIHNVIAEVYSLSLAFQLVLLAIALWSPVTPANARARVHLLALIGGLGVAHHRMVAFLAPGLLLAVWPGLFPDRTARTLRRAAGTLFTAIPIALIGFIPYIYLPLRAQAGAVWVYGNPVDWPGLWHEFTGAEAAFLMQPPPDGAALLADAVDTLRILATELTPVVALCCALTLPFALLRSGPVRIGLVCAAGHILFLLVFHRAVMPEAVAMFPVAMLILGLTMTLSALPTLNLTHRAALNGLAIGVAALGAALLIGAHRDFITQLTHNTIGVEAIATAKRVPRDDGRGVLMLPWSSRYTAVAFSKYVTGENADLRIATHKADFGALARAGDTIYTFRDIFYRFPLDWWDVQIGRAYLSAAAADVVSIRTAPYPEPPAMFATMKLLPPGILYQGAHVCRDTNTLHLIIFWQAQRPTDTSLSVFVHLLGAEGDAPIAQADSSAPVYGWYPTTRWSPGETVIDRYTLPFEPNGARLRFGFYTQPEPGTFVNYEAATLPVDSALECAR